MIQYQSHLLIKVGGGGGGGTNHAQIDKGAWLLQSNMGDVYYYNNLDKIKKKFACVLESLKVVKRLSCSLTVRYTPD